MSSATTRAAIAALGDAPFTLRTAERVGLSAGMLRGAACDGLVRRLLWGSYVATSTPVNRQVRVAAARLLVPADRILTGAGAAWVHGAPLPDAYGPADGIRVTSMAQTAARTTAVPGDVVALGGVLLTSPERTALDLAAVAVDRDQAVVVIDAFRRAGLVTQRSLSVRIAAWRDRTACERLRGVVALSEDRSSGTAETLLRLWWREAELPTPVPGLVHHGVRRSLGLPIQRFTVTVTGAALPAPVPGWLDVTVPSHRVHLAARTEVVAHLRREYYEHLLRRSTWLESSVWSRRPPIR